MRIEVFSLTLFGGAVYRVSLITYLLLEVYLGHLNVQVHQAFERGIVDCAFQLFLQ